MPIGQVKLTLGLKGDLPGEGDLFTIHWPVSSSTCSVSSPQNQIIELLDHRFEVVDMDQHRIDKVLVVPGGTNRRLSGGQRGVNPACIHCITAASVSQRMYWPTPVATSRKFPL